MHRPNSPSSALRQVANCGLAVLLAFVVVGNLSCEGSVTAAAVARCDGIQQPNEDSVDSLYDLDGDGFFDSEDTGCAYTYDAAQLDCNDLDPLIHPDAGETSCNDLDDDCNELTPDFVDNDSDGSTTCFDCDDEDAARSPDFDEALCSGIDEDCDEDTVDEVDVDQDGTTNCTDCDDNDPGRHPELKEELCNGIDEDCTSDESPDPSPDDLGIDLDHDEVSNCTDCDDLDAENFPGNDEQCDGQDNDCDLLVPDDEFDNDDDGVSPCDGDCNDDDGSIHPGAVDECGNGDGNDQDCSGEADDGC